jgi:hypothetical protein
MRTFYHHFLTRGCELAGCPAPDLQCDLYVIEGERRAVRACSGAHARAAAARQELEAEIERAAEQAARMAAQSAGVPADAAEDLEAWLDAHQPDLGCEWMPADAERER